MAKTKSVANKSEPDAAMEEFKKAMAPYQPDIAASSKAAKESERKLIAEHAKNIQSGIPIVDVEVEGNSLTTKVRESSTHNRILHSSVVAKAFGVKDLFLANRHLDMLLNASIPRGEFKTETYNGVLNAMHEMAPTDPVEGMLASQMVAVHSLAMECLRRAQNAERMPIFESNAREANRLMRTYTAQADALKRYRAKANQTVRVERVYVNEGAQAIVGDVHHNGGGDTQKTEDQCHAKQVAHAPEPEMWSEDQEGHAVPFPSDQGKEKVPNARG